MDLTGHADYNPGHGFQSMDLTGHADYNPGQDVVCAGISALAFALAGELHRRKGVSKKRFSLTDGIHVEVEPFCDPNDQAIVDAVFETTLTGLRQIEKKYPGHIEVSEVVL